MPDIEFQNPSIGNHILSGSKGELCSRLPEGVYGRSFEDCATALRRYRRLRARVLEAGGRIIPEYLHLETGQDKLEQIFEKLYGPNMRGHKDVYNITPPIEFKGHTFLAWRAQPQGMNLHSISGLAEINGDRFNITDHIALPNFEDPSMFTITNEKGNEELVYTGVKVLADDGGRLKNWFQVFYGTQDLGGEWREIARGPDKMKDIRARQDPKTGEILFFGRPQREFKGVNYGAGNITFGRVPGIGYFTPEAISQAKPIDRKFAGNNWGGINYFDFLTNGLIRADGHIAKRTDSGRAYFAFMLLYDPASNKSFDIGITLESADGISPKSHPWELEGRDASLRNVVFTGGVDREGVIWIGRNDLWGQKVKSSVIDYYLGNLEVYSEQLFKQREAKAA